MKLSLISILTAVTAVIAQSTQIRSRTCGNEPSAEEVLQMEADFAVNKVNVQADPPAPVNVNVYFHVIHKDMTIEGGYIADDQITDQIDVMNAAFVNASITFSLANTTRTQDPSWFNIDLKDKTQDKMKTTLREGGAGDLNIYSVGSIISKKREYLLGYATFPDNYSNNAKDDGVVLLFSSLPGGSLKPYDLGQTATHEAGHWVGLFHTFQDGCSSPGDYVDDTPPEKYESTGCPAGRDTCVDGLGDDPIHNFMDYSDDSCLNNFTPGQVERLRSKIATYRNLK